MGYCLDACRDQFKVVDTYDYTCAPEDQQKARLGWLNGLVYHPHCPLFARKFQGRTAGDLMKHLEELGVI